jgi:hypothetical protein
VRSCASVPPLSVDSVNGKIHFVFDFFISIRKGLVLAGHERYYVSQGPTVALAPTAFAHCLVSKT